MSVRTMAVKAIEEEIVRVRMERDALTNRLEGLETALRLAKGEASPNFVDLEKGRQKRGNVKTAVLDAVTASGEKGVSVTECVADAKSRSGLDLDRGSVSSLMSRLKKDGVFFYNGDRYRLKEYAGPRHAA